MRDYPERVLRMGDIRLHPKPETLNPKEKEAWLNLLPQEEVTLDGR